MQVLDTEEHLRNREKHRFYNLNNAALVVKGLKLLLMAMALIFQNIKLVECESE